MSETSKDFFKILDNEVQLCWKEIRKLIITSKTSISRIDFEVKLPIEILEKFGLNDKIEFMIKSTPNGGETVYFYDGFIVEPDAYYLRPTDYHEVSTLKMLQECVNQKTNKPDIKFLERGEESN